MENFKQASLSTSQEFNSVRVVLLLLVIVGCFVFIGYNLYNRNFSLVGNVYYPWGDNSQVSDTFTLSITDSQNQPVAHDLMGVNVEAVFDTVGFSDPNLNAFLDAAGFTNYRFPGAEANLFHFNMVVPDEYKSCPEKLDTHGKPIYVMPENALNWGHGHWPCQVIDYNQGNAYDEDVDQGTFDLQKTAGHNYIDEFATMASRVGAAQMYTVNPSTSSVADVVDTLTALRQKGIETKYVELGEEHYLQGTNVWYCDMTSPCVYDVNDYITRVKPYAQAIRSFDPSIIIVADAPPYWKSVLSHNNSFANWNSTLAVAINSGDLPADGVATHFYPPIKNPPVGSSGSVDCSTYSGIDAIMSCSLFAHSFNSHQMVTDTIDYYRGLMPGKKVLFTEYNTDVDGTVSYSNTLIQALYVGGLLNTINEYNTIHPGAVPVTDIHALAGFIFGPISPRQGESFVDSVGDWDETTNQVVNTTTAGSAGGSAIRRASYWPLKFISQVFKGNMIVANTNLSTTNHSQIIYSDTNPNFRVTTYKSTDGKYQVYINNFSGLPLKLSANGNTYAFTLNNSPISLSTPVTYNYISGTHLYAGRGKTNIHGDGLISSEETASVYQDVDTKLGDLVVPGYSFGYFTLNTSEIINATVCDDGLDNDGDSLKDYPNDPGCTDTNDNDETDSVSLNSPCVVSDPNTTGNLRYCNEIYDQSEIVVTSGIEFSPTYNLKFDLYTPPLSDTKKDRAWVVHNHGGGGTTESSSSFCNKYARMGYVCIGGDYRGGGGSGYTVPEQTFSASDTQALIRFVRLHVDEYGIDPNKVMLGGISAGGVTSMLAAYSGNDTDNTSWFKSATKNADNSTYPDGSVVPSWSCMVTTESGPLSPPAYDLIDANDPPAAFFLGGEDNTHGWHCSDPDDGKNDDGDEALAVMQGFNIPSYFKCFDDSDHSLGQGPAIDAVVIPKAYDELIIEGCPQSYSNLSQIQVVDTSPAHLTTIKVVINNDGGTKQVSDFPLSVSGTSVTSGVSTEFQPGTYTATEGFDENYVATFSGDCDSGGTITLSAGDNKTCTITNNDIAQNVTTTSGGTTDGSTNTTTTSTTADTTSTTDGSTTNSTSTSTTTTTVSDTPDPTTTTSSSSGGSFVDPTTTTTSTTGVAQDITGTTSGGTGEVPPAPLPSGGLCTPYLTTYIQYGYTNNTDDVTRLQNFLNSHEGESLAVTGNYDDPSFEAVKRFQSKYASSVLTVWGLTEPTGYVYKTTRNKINSFNCNTVITCPAFVGDFVPGETDPEISKIKSLLNDLGFAAGAGEYYDDTMKTAVVDFQETFHKVILDPWGLVNGTAWIHNTTRKYLNDLVGCVTPPADLDGKGSFEY